MSYSLIPQAPQRFWLARLCPSPTDLLDDSLERIVHLSERHRSVRGLRWRREPLGHLISCREPNQVITTSSLWWPSSINRNRNSCHWIPLIRRLRLTEWKALWKGDAALIITDTIVMAILGKSSFVPLLISIDVCHSCPAITFQTSYS